jgi:hypothetical protein
MGPYLISGALPSASALVYDIDGILFACRPLPIGYEAFGAFLRNRPD